jgi:hypothetical protein
VNIVSAQEISVLIEKIARNLQSAIWVLQNTMEDLQRLGISVSKVARTESEDRNINNQLRIEKDSKSDSR